MNKNEPDWHLLDARDLILGRLATQAATLLRGKQKLDFVPYLNCGDHVVVINAASIRVTGRKLETKQYYHYSGYPGGMKEASLKKLLFTKPEQVIYAAVKGMLPRNKLQEQWLQRLHIYAGSEHPHQANVSA